MNTQEYEQHGVSGLARESGLCQEHLNIKRYRCRRFMFLLIGLLFMAGWGLLAPTPVWAEADDQLEITGDGVVNPVRFSLEQLQAMEQYEHVYSTINTWPTKKWYVGRGIKLRDLLDIAAIKEDAKLIIFTSSDGYSVTLTVKELLKDPRYDFPGLQENSVNDGSIPGSSEGAEEVEPILALLTAEGSNNPEEMNDMNSLQLICGQRAVSEQTNNLFLKYINKIEVLTTEPPKWDKPRVNIGSGEVPAGTMLELNTKGNDTDKIYFTTDGSTPTINSPMFNWSAKRWWSQRPDSLGSINKPIEIKEGTVIKAITIGPGRADSEVVTFIYQIGDPDKPQIPGGPANTVTLDEENLELTAGASYMLAATVGPDNAVDKSVTWTSSDTRVAVVDNNGLVTMVGSGTAVITVKTINGLTASCRVTTKDKDTAKPAAEDDDIHPAEQPEGQVNPVEPVVPEAETVKVVEAAQDPFGDQEETTNIPDVPQEGQEEWQYLQSRLLPDKSTNKSAPQAGSQAWQVYEVSAGGVLDELPEQPDSQTFFMIIIFTCLFFTGAGRRYMEYKKEEAR